MKICPQCMGEGAFSYPCKKCDGAGTFISVVDQVVVSCRVCGGTGRFFPIWKGDRSLKSFNFPFIIRVLPSGKEEFVHRCRTCRGTGKVDPTNNLKLVGEPSSFTAEDAHHAFTGD